MKKDIPVEILESAPLPKDGVAILKNGEIAGVFFAFEPDDALVLDETSPCGFCVVKVERHGVIKLAHA